VRTNAAASYQIGNPIGDYPGFATAGPGQDKYRPFDGLGSFSLGGIKRS
jgi:hypothetical protein